VSTAEFNRADRVGSAMQRELAVLIRDLKDLPGGLVTVQEVRVSRDLSHAKVYFTVIGADADHTLADLKHAAGYLRRELGHAMRLRSVPELHFVYDTSIADGERLDSLIETAVARDSRVRAEDDE
jgi:ribosome-binding factor A